MTPENPQLQPGQVTGDCILGRGFVSQNMLCLPFSMLLLGYTVYLLPRLPSVLVENHSQPSKNTKFDISVWISDFLKPMWIFRVVSYPISHAYIHMPTKMSENPEKDLIPPELPPGTLNNQFFMDVW